MSTHVHDMFANVSSKFKWGVTFKDREWDLKCERFGKIRSVLNGQNKRTINKFMVTYTVKCVIVIGVHLKVVIELLESIVMRRRKTGFVRWEDIIVGGKRCRR